MSLNKTKTLLLSETIRVSWIIFLFLPSMQADFRTLPSPYLPPRPPSSTPDRHIFSLEPSSSSLHKIIHQHGFPLHSQPTKIGASKLHQFIQRMGHLQKFSKSEQEILKTNDRKEDVGIHIPSSIKNITRLKRQLEGIFHVGGTPATTPINDPTIRPTEKPSQAIYHHQNDVNQNGLTKTAKKEIIQEDIPKSNNNYPDTNTKRFGFTDTDVPRANNNDKRNFTVEIVEISRKTLITQDLNDDDGTVTNPDNKKNIDSKASLQNINFLKPSSLFHPVRPRIRFRKLRLPTPTQILDDSQNSQTAKKETINDNVIKINKPIREEHKNDPKSQDSPVQVNVNYQEQIPYNERDIDESDLKDYLDGHSTFGAKGNFKHTVSRNVTRPAPLLRKIGHEVRKRAPQVTTSDSSPRARTRGQQVNIEKAKVNQVNSHPQTTVYTAARPIELPDPEDNSKAVFEYQGNRAAPPKPEKPQTPKNPSSFQELFRQGHPGILEAPRPIYKGHPLGEPYGQQDDNEHQENPYRANPLIDDPPLKFDPESDRFYGNPRPEKERLAQSNRPEPVRIENSENQTPQNRREDKEEPSTSRPRTDNNDDQQYNSRHYGPSDFDYERATDIADKDPDTDPYIRDFVSLDSNFETLPRPSAADESFRSLIPAEAEDDNNPQYDDEPDRNSDYRGRDDDNRDRDRDDDRPSRNEDYRDESRENSRPRPRQRSNDDYPDDDDRDSRERDNNRNDNSDEGEPGDFRSDDFDPTYLDSLKTFDDELKRFEENDRKGATTGDPTSTTREPPLVITSPGPVVPYPTRGNLMRPTHSTTPVDEPREPDDEQDGDNGNNRSEERNRQPDDEDDRSAGTGKPEEGKDDEEEETEEPEETPQLTTAKTVDDMEGEKDQDGEGSRKKRMGIKISRSSKKLSSSDKPEKDNPGNLDEDISSIEREFRMHGTISK